MWHVLEELEYHDYMLLDLRYRMPQYAKTVIQENYGDDSRITFLYSEVFSTLMKSNRYALQFSLVSLASLSSLKYRQGEYYLIFQPHIEKSPTFYSDAVKQDKNHMSAN